ncbi:MAG: hypothetical protein B7Y15_13540 [Bacteroidetes bacterium 24-39-8]|jgi:hypothetical protein|nr:MAG: hypothetical protein B7Y15_13540 [Bacteroidetes bacterium 24-39-8]OZA65955.1 MAG: hypothetical protein B7X72_06705 [Sphingobacteriia bacterium 39-39-8]HQR92124.1 hypothetical protein [Sediminibacterium sp.]HQS54869.1 hypothetical protein [Sediminibacterium sp.]
MQIKSFITSFLIASSFFANAQKINWEKKEFELVNTKASIVTLGNYTNVLKVERDLVAFPFDEKNLDATVDGPSFVKLSNLNIENGSIEVKVLSKIMENNPFPAARGFIGLAYRIDQDNKHFDAIYLRPSNGRADDQLRRNHSVQYFAYPNYGFNKLRKEANGLYETYANIGLEEWITMRIVFQEKKARLYLNQQEQPAFLVNEMLGNSKNGSIGLWVEIGTIGFFKDLKIQ